MSIIVPDFALFLFDLPAEILEDGLLALKLGCQSVSFRFDSLGSVGL